MRALLACFLALLVSACAGAVKPAEDSAATQVMVLGVWHFANPGLDLANVTSDDVLAANRQAELERVAAALAAVGPTMIAVERITAAPGYVDPGFADFNDEQLRTNRSERVQIAYRLARKAGVTRVLGVDEQLSDGEPDYFPFEELEAQASANGQNAKLDSDLAAVQAATQRFSEQQKNRTMADLLIEMNNGEESSPALYYDLVRFDHGEAQAGAELNAYWFMRNAKIFSK